MKNKDILILCQFFYPEYVTSALLPYQTAEELVKNGFSVDVFTGYPKEYNSNKDIPKNEIINGINITRLKYLQLSRASKISRLVNYFAFFITVLFQLPKMKKYKSIIVYSNPPIIPLVAVLANKLFKTKIVFVAYDIYPEMAINTEIFKEESFISKIMNQINNQLYEVADVVALSNDMKKFILKNRKISSDRVHVINNWATENVIDTKNGKSSEFTISYFGNMGIPQEFYTLLRAFNHESIKAANIKLQLAGHGNQRTKLEEYIKENNIINAEILAYLQGKEFEEAISNTDVFFLSLKDSMTGLAVPSKFYTYLLSNKPILAVINDNTDIAKEIKEFNLGYSIEEGNVKSLVNKILLLKDNYQLYNFKKIYESNYSKETQLKKYVNLMKNIIHDKEGK